MAKLTRPEEKREELNISRWANKIHYKGTIFIQEVVNQPQVNAAYLTAFFETLEDPT